MTLIGFGASENFLLLAVLVAFLGASNNLWHPAAISFISAGFPRNRGYALSIHALGANLGDAIAPIVAGALLLWLSWRGTAIVGALPILALAFLIAMLLLPRDRKAADGVKTGFTCASGYNLAASAERGGRRLIAIVLGAKTSAVRNVTVTKLLNRGFEALNGSPAAGRPGLGLGAKRTHDSYSGHSDRGPGPGEPGSHSIRPARSRSDARNR